MTRKRKQKTKVLKLLFFNAALLLVLKLVLPLSQFHLAQLIQQVLPYTPDEIVMETNKARLERGLPALHQHYALDIAAAEKLNDMVSRGYFAHVSPDGITPWHWIQKNRYGYISAGENLALGFISPGDAVGGWLDSESHRANLLNTSYTDIGVAVGHANLEGINGVLVVQVFGQPARVAAAAHLSDSDVQTLATNVVTGEEAMISEIINVAAGVETSEVVDLAYISYLSLVLGALAVVVIKVGLDKMMVASISGHVALLLIAFLIPALGVSGSGIIF